MDRSPIAPLTSILVRAHDPAQAWVLHHALRSLLEQDYPQIEAVLILQNFSANDKEVLSSEWSPQFAKKKFSLQLLSLEQEGDKDLRSKALNLGMKAAHGEYLGFLDYDDVLYPNAISRLAKVLSETDAGCAVGGCTLSRVRFDSKSQTIESLNTEKFFFDTPSVERLKQNSFIPIHSFLLKRGKIPVNATFPEHMSLFEDYAFLLSLIPSLSFDFSLFSSAAVCEYRVPVNEGQSIAQLRKNFPADYKKNRQEIWQQRKKLGMLGFGFYLCRPFYYPLKTKVYRFFKRL